MAMAVQHGALLYGCKLEVELPGGGFARQKLFKEQGRLGHAACRVALDQRGNFVTEAEQTARLQTDDRHAVGSEWRQRGERALRFVACFIHLPDRQKRAAT